MGLILEFFEPMTLGEWFGKFLLLIAGSFVFVWLLALILSQTQAFIKKDIELAVYLSWLTGFAIYTLLMTVFLITISAHYKRLDISLWHSVPFLLIIIVSDLVGLSLFNKITGKLSELEKELKKEDKK